MTSPPDKRKALGRGLGALMPPPPPPPASATGAAPASSIGNSVKRDFFTVGIEEVHPSGANPRSRFDEGQLTELAESIRQHGLVQPLIVRHRPPAEGTGFSLIAGERRWRAAQRAGLKQVPVVVKETSPRGAFELALVENLQRADLNPIEEAEAFRRMCDDFGYTQEQTAERVGRDRVSVSNALRLLKLPPRVRAMVADGELSMGHARALLGLGLDDARILETTAAQVASKGLSVRQTEAMVRREREPRVLPANGKPVDNKKTASARDLETRLSRSLKARVRVVEKSAQAGHIEIDYATLDDLDRLIEQLLR